VDETITENKPKIGNIFDNLEETSENFNEFSQDIKHHPWKILAKGKEMSKEELARERAERHAARKKSAPVEASAQETSSAETAPEPVKPKQNFAVRRP
jgi:hypothetical protein